MHAFYQVIQYFLEPSLTPTAAKNISAESLQIKENATHFFPGQFLLNQILWRVWFKAAVGKFHKNMYFTHLSMTVKQETDNQ